MKFLKQNWSCRLGEIDLIMQDKEELVLVEVKTRRDSREAKKHIFDNITRKKQRKLAQLAEVYLRYQYPQSKPPVRIDVVGVILDWDQQSIQEIRHLVAAISRPS